MLPSLDEACRKEWLVTNGLRGYASSTVPDLNTRKYHGLLVASLHPPGDRRVLLTKLDEDIYVENNVFRLGINEFETRFFHRAIHGSKNSLSGLYLRLFIRFQRFLLPRKSSCHTKRTL
jgi:glycogen debranching enzyme